MKNFLLKIFLLLSVLVYAGCGVVKQTQIERTYVNTQKVPTDTSITVMVPKIGLISGTHQQQKKGDVMVSCELIPLDINRIESTEESVTYLDPKKPDYDVYEIIIKPIYEIVPNEINFKLKIRNNQDRVLKLIEVPVILIIDGIQTSIANEQLVDWKGALIPKGFEKEFIIKGPKINNVHEAKNIYIGIHDVPISYDAAGNVKKKENFDWTFVVSKEKVIKNDRISYNYKSSPVYKEKCIACGGGGEFIETANCSYCKGNGKVKNKEGKIVTCSACNGSGKVNYKRKCDTCSGMGFIKHPQSTTPPIVKEVIWTGWDVEVESIPIGAKVSIVDYKTGSYKNIGRSNIKVQWYQCMQNSSPILVEMNDKSVKVLPFNKEGEAVGKVVVDFQNNSIPKVIEGQVND